MIPSPPKHRCAQAVPKSALAVISTPAITASEVSAKYVWPVMDRKPNRSIDRPSRGTTG